MNVLYAYASRSPNVLASKQAREHLFPQHPLHPREYKSSYFDIKNLPLSFLWFIDFMEIPFIIVSRPSLLKLDGIHV